MISWDGITIIDIYSLLVTIIATLFAITSLVLTFVGYFKFKEADKLVEKKIKEKLSEFESVYEETLIDIQNANAKINSSYQYFSNQQYDKIIKILKEAEKIYPRAYNLYNTMGYAYQELKEIASAKDCFEKAIIYHPRRIEGYNDMANLYKKLGDNKKAGEYYKRALKKVPNAKDNWQDVA